MIQNLCRLCAMLKDDMMNIRNDTDYKQGIKQQIQDLLGIRIQHDDNLPTQICKYCVTELQRAFNFINRCRNAQTTLKQHCESYAKNVKVTKFTDQDFLTLDSAQSKSLNLECQIDTAENEEIRDTRPSFLNKDNEDNIEFSNINERSSESSSDVDNGGSRKSRGNIQCNTATTKGKVRRSLKKKTLICTVCKISFSRKSAYEEHLNVHNGNRPFVCSICEATFRKRQELNQHMRTIHSEKQFKCSSCAYVAKHRGKLTEHVKSIHEKPFTCGVCSYRTGEKGKILQHIANKHSCDSCYVCELCGKCFKTKNSLQTHQQNIHFPEPKVCQTCGIVCPSLTKYSAHIFRCGKKKQRYTCDFCGQTYVNKEILKDHMNKHLNVKPYKCDVCEKEFFQRNRLNTHKYVHRGLFYHCEVCKQSFNRKDNMINHMKKHFYKSVKCDNVIVTAV